MHWGGKRWEYMKQNTWTKQFCGLHTITHKFKGDLLDNFGCRYLILIPVQYAYNLYQKTKITFFSPILPTMTKSQYKDHVHSPSSTSAHVTSGQKACWHFMVNVKINVLANYYTLNLCLVQTLLLELIQIWCSPGLKFLSTYHWKRSVRTCKLNMIFDLFLLPCLFAARWSATATMSMETINKSVHLKNTQMPFLQPPGEHTNRPLFSKNSSCLERLAKIKKFNEQSLNKGAPGIIHKEY